jgi:nicotinamidase-related amidase
MAKRKTASSGQIAQHRHAVALLITDMLNTFDFPEGKQLFPAALRAARAIAKLKAKFKEQNVPVIYINDNFGQWQSDWKTVYEACSSRSCLGRPIAELLKPESDDYFVLKPKHSGFYSTTLDVLLEHLGTEVLVLTGIAGNICVLFTANDAHMREFQVVVPRDCTASNTRTDHEFTLKQLEKVLGIETKASSHLRLSSLQKAAKKR